MRCAIVLLAVAAAIMASPVNTLDQEVLKGYLENGAPFDFVLLDIRGADEITKAIGNAECKPYNLVWPEQFKDLSTKIPKDRAIIVYCQSGGRATRAAEFLDANGYTQVYNAGGIRTWTGPTIPPSDIKPASALPEPSCKARK